MGIYSSRLYESAVQDPNNVGVDLDQVEENIMNSTDDEAATDVIDVDPVEEAAIIMSEGTYNYNQLMKAIGIAELREASYGRDIIYEAVDVKAFLNKIKKWLVDQFEKITKAVRSILAKMDIAEKMQKKFVKDHKSDIDAGYSLVSWDKEKKFFYIAQPELDKFDAQSSKAEKHVADCEKYINDIKDGKDVQNDFTHSAKDYEVLKTFIIQELSGIPNVSSIKDMQSELIKKYIKKDTTIDGKVSSSDVIKILSDGRETRAIRTAYEKVKKSYKKSLNDIENLKKKIDQKDYNDGFTKALNVCENITRTIKFEKDVANGVYSSFIKIARARRSMAMAIARKCVSAKKKGVHESTDYSRKLSGKTIFSGIDLM